jgi:hypothetical protein
MTAFFENHAMPPWYARVVDSDVSILMCPNNQSERWFVLGLIVTFLKLELRQSFWCRVQPSAFAGGKSWLLYPLTILEVRRPLLRGWKQPHQRSLVPMLHSS